MESKLNYIPDQKKNRLRGENWTQEEKDLLLKIMRKSAAIIENKATDTNSNSKKNLEWNKIQHRLREFTGKKRDIAQIKGFWRRTKLSVKKSISQNRKALKATSEDQVPSPPPDYLKILELCTTDFVIGDNIYDNDSTSASSQITDQDKDDNNIIEVQEQGADNKLEHSFTTVTDVVNKENNTRASGSGIKTEAQYVGMGEERQFERKVDKEDESIEKQPKKNFTSKESIVDSNIQFKKRAETLLEEEHKMKMKYHEQELAHQRLRHKLEIDILLIEQEKKKLELEILKKNLGSKEFD